MLCVFQINQFSVPPLGSCNMAVINLTDLIWKIENARNLSRWFFLEMRCEVRMKGYKPFARSSRYCITSFPYMQCHIAESNSRFNGMSQFAILVGPVYICCCVVVSLWFSAPPIGRTWATWLRDNMVIVGRRSICTGRTLDNTSSVTRNQH